jgi:hypothetical protein
MSTQIMPAQMMSTQMMPARRSCAECDRVWEDYTHALTAHVKSVARRHKAALQSDSAVPDEILAIEADLAQKQIKARRAIDDHEAGHEPVLAGRGRVGMKAPASVKLPMALALASRERSSRSEQNRTVFALDCM